MHYYAIFLWLQLSLLTVKIEIGDSWKRGGKGGFGGRGGGSGRAQFIAPLQCGLTTLLLLPLHLFLLYFLPIRCHFGLLCLRLMLLAHVTSCDPFPVQHAGKQDEDEAMAGPDDRVQHHFGPGVDRQGECLQLLFLLLPLLWIIFVSNAKRLNFYFLFDPEKFGDQLHVCSVSSRIRPPSPFHGSMQPVTVGTWRRTPVSFRSGPSTQVSMCAKINTQTKKPTFGHVQWPHEPLRA